MRTVKQVSALTGVSVRTLQFYDEIGLLKPTSVTEAGYRLYGDGALEVLQQILFFKELDFSLKEIKAILENPAFDRRAAFAGQRALIALKRDRLDRLLELLDRLLKGENSMEFEQFGMDEYFRRAEDFKRTHGAEIAARMGSLEAFDGMLADLRAREGEIAAQAAQTYGGVEAFTRAMEQTLGAYLEQGPAVAPEDVAGLAAQTDELTRRLLADLGRDPASPEVRALTGELIAFTESCGGGAGMGENHWGFMAGQYAENPAFIKAADGKYGAGAAAFLSRAIRAYLDAPPEPADKDR